MTIDKSRISIWSRRLGAIVVLSNGQIVGPGSQQVRACFRPNVGCATTQRVFQLNSRDDGETTLNSSFVGHIHQMLIHHNADRMNVGVDAI